MFGPDPALAGRHLAESNLAARPCRREQSPGRLGVRCDVDRNAALHLRAPPARNGRSRSAREAPGTARRTAGASCECADKSIRRAPSAGI